MFGGGGEEAGRKRALPALTSTLYYYNKLVVNFSVFEQSYKREKL